MPAAVRDRFERAVERRASGWPQQYAAGRANFRGHWLAVDGRVLIPRAETEGLVELVVREVVGAPAPAFSRGGASPPVVADIGTGSGAIAIALALEAPVAGVIATDTSAGALTLAMENAAALGARDRIAFRRGHLCEPLLDDRVDVLVSNLPYVTTAEWEQLDPSVRVHEPRLALDGGPDGLGVIRDLVRQAPRVLLAGGLIALETDSRRASATARLLSDSGFAGVTLHNDLFGRPRYVLGRRAE